VHEEQREPALALVHVSDRGASDVSGV
jgi:hypothetical protein